MLLNFQTMISELVALPISNASLLDEATAAAEAVLMSYNIHNGKRKKVFVSNSIFPQTIDVIKTRAESIGLDVVIGHIYQFDLDFASEYCGFILQNPDNLGFTYSLDLQI